MTNPHLLADDTPQVAAYRGHFGGTLTPAAAARLAAVWDGPQVEPDDLHHSWDGKMPTPAHRMAARLLGLYFAQAGARPARAHGTIRAEAHFAGALDLVAALARSHDHPVRMAVITASKLATVDRGAPADGIPSVTGQVKRERAAAINLLATWIRVETGV